MAIVIKKGIKYIKINKVDALGNDKTPLLRQLQNIRLVYGDIAVTQYDVFGVTEYPTYFQYQVNYANATSSTDTGILNYTTEASASTGIWAGPWVSADQTLAVVSMSQAPVTNSRFNTSSGVYKLQSTTLEHYPNTTIQITASVNYVPNPPGSIYPRLLLTREGLQSPLASVTASNVTTAGTLVLTASMNSSDIASVAQASRNGLQFRVYNDDAINPAEFSDFKLRVNQSQASTSYTQRLAVPSPNTSIPFAGTDCDVTYGFVDVYNQSQYFMDVDYSTGLAIPTNQAALISGSATKAQVKDYYYTLQAQTTPRYKGVRVSQLELNKYTGPSNTLLINGDSYPGDTGYGKSPNIELRRAYVAWFSSLSGASPEVNNAVNINIKYLIDGLGNTYSPELTRYFLPELVGNFTNGDTLTLNFVDDISGTNTTPNDIKVALNGSRRVIRSGLRAGAVLYNQTGSGVNAYTQSLQFTTIEDGSAYKAITDYRFGAQRNANQTIAAGSGVSQLIISSRLWDFNNGYDGPTSRYTFSSTPQSKIRFLINIKKMEFSRGETAIIIRKNGNTTPIYRASYNKGAYFPQLITEYYDFVAGDYVEVFVERVSNADVEILGPVEWLAEQQLLTQLVLPLTTAPFFFTSSANPYILTASFKFSSSIDQVYQANISGSGFDPIRSKVSFIPGDQFRFENNEVNTYTINKIISSSRETSNGETHILLDQPISPGTDVDKFLLRRFYADSSNIIIEGIKPAGGTGPGSISPQYVTQQLEDNLSSIIAKLSRENSI